MSPKMSSDQCCEVVVMSCWTIHEIKELLNTDPNLQQAIVWVESLSFPDHFPKGASFNVQTYWYQRNQLTLENGILYRRWKDVLGGGLHPKLQLMVSAKVVLIFSPAYTIHR